MSEPSTRLRVGFYVFFPAGGIGRYTHELMKTMTRRSDVEVEVLCTPEYQWAGRDGYFTWDGLASISHEVPTIRRARFLKGQFVNPVRALQRAEEADLDVLHLANINHLTFPYWRSVGETEDIAIVASVHDVRRGKSIINRTWEDRQLKAFYRFADALFVHSEYQARELNRFADVRREKIRVVPHGPYAHGTVEITRPEARARWDLPRDRPVALFFGKLRDEKNLEGFLRAVARIEDPLHVVVAGRGGGRHRGADHYVELAERLGLADRTSFHTRYLDDEEVGELFTAADWVALPYEESFTSQSGVLNVAAHYERPVLVSSAPVLRETVEACDVGVVCEGDDPPQIAAGIERICRRVMVDHEHAFDTYRQRFGWEENVTRTIETYRRVLTP